MSGTSTIRARLRDALPTGSTLPDPIWRARHRAILVLLWVHVAALPFIGAWQGRGFWPVLGEAAPIGGLALAAMLRGAPRVVRASITTFALVLCSAVLVHLFDGLSELHFHFFVVIAVVSLFQMWTPYLLGVGFVLLHHATMGALAPRQVYHHPLALAHPLILAVVHGAFVLAESVALLAYWRGNERTLEAEREARATVEETNLALTTAHEEVSDLVAMLSHDLRSPLTSINGFTSILRAAPDLPSARVADLLRRIAESGRHLELMLDDALSATALEAHGIVPEPQPVRLDEAVRDVLDLMPVPLPGVDLDGLEPALGLVDPGHLVQVLTNLVTNAQKYGAPPYLLCTRGDGERAVVSLADHGDGVPAEFEDRLFERFARAERHRAGTVKGTGLGLYIAHRLALANGGELRHDRPASGGARFSLALPGVPLPASPTVPADRRAPLEQRH